MKINSFLPNPVGPDKGHEFFTIFNDSKNTVSLHNWQVKDEANKGFWLFGELGPNEEATFFLKNTSLVLNNNGETLYLYSPQGNLEDELSYIGKAKEGQIIRKEIEISAEMKAELFEPYAFQSMQANVLSASTQSPVFLAVAFALILAGTAVLLINKIPKSEEEELLEEFADEKSNLGKLNTEEWIS